MKNESQTTKTGQRPKQQRLVLEVPEEFVEEVDNLRDECGFTSRRETVAHACGLLSWAAREILAGRRIGALDPEGNNFGEIVPFGPRLLLHYRRNGQQANQPAYAAKRGKR
jgi:hypothetical protein